MDDHGTAARYRRTRGNTYDTAEGGVLLSLPLDRIDLAQQVDVGIELKLHWEDAPILTGDRDLTAVLDQHGISPEQVVSVHLPPGSSGRRTDMAVSADNVQRITDFVHGQLSGVNPEFLVLHTVRRFDYREHLTLLRTLLSVTGQQLSVENTPDASYWYTPEDIAFFAYAATVTDSLAGLGVTLDTAHLPAGRDTVDEVNPDAIEALFDRFDPAFQERVGEEFKEFVAANRTQFSVPGETAASPWIPVLNALCLAGDQMVSVHLNDPARDGVPPVTAESAGIEAVVATCRQLGVYLVLEPDESQFEDAAFLENTISQLQ